MLTKERACIIKLFDGHNWLHNTVSQWVLSMSEASFLTKQLFGYWQRTSLLFYQIIMCTRCLWHWPPYLLSYEIHYLSTNDVLDLKILCFWPKFWIRLKCLKSRLNFVRKMKKVPLQLFATCDWKFFPKNIIKVTNKISHFRKLLFNFFTFKCLKQKL